MEFIESDIFSKKKFTPNDVFLLLDFSKINKGKKKLK